MNIGSIFDGWSIMDWLHLSNIEVMATFVYLKGSYLSTFMLEDFGSTYLAILGLGL